MLLLYGIALNLYQTNLNPAYMFCTLKRTTPLNRDLYNSCYNILKSICCLIYIECYSFLWMTCVCFI